jgi:hypothetical protein
MARFWSRLVHAIIFACVLAYAVPGLGGEEIALLPVKLPRHVEIQVPRGWTLSARPLPSPGIPAGSPGATRPQARRRLLDPDTGACLGGRPPTHRQIDEAPEPNPPRSRSNELVSQAVREIRG